MEAHVWAKLIIKKTLMSFAIEKTPHISLSCNLTPAQYRELKNNLLHKQYQLKRVSVSS